MERRSGHPIAREGSVEAFDRRSVLVRRRGEAEGAARSIARRWRRAGWATSGSISSPRKCSWASDDDKAATGSCLRIVMAARTRARSSSCSCRWRRPGRSPRTSGRTCRAKSRETISRRLWSFWWMRQTLSSSDLDFWRTTFLFHPGGVDLVQHTHTALNAWIGATVLGGVSEITALNVVLLGALTLAGFGTYLLAWDVTGHRGASIVAGVFFCSAPFFPARLLGHFNFVSAWGLPFFAWLWLRALAAGRGRRGHAGRLWPACGRMACSRLSRTPTTTTSPTCCCSSSACSRCAGDGFAGSVRPRADRLDVDRHVARRAARHRDRVHIAIAMTGGFTLHVGGRAHLDAQRPERQDRRVGAGADRRVAAHQAASAHRARERRDAVNRQPPRARRTPRTWRPAASCETPACSPSR